MDHGLPSMEPVAPLEHLRLTECSFPGVRLTPEPPTTSDVSTAYTSTMTTLSFPDCRLISESVDLITTVFTPESSQSAPLPFGHASHRATSTEELPYFFQSFSAERSSHPSSESAVSTSTCHMSVYYGAILDTPDTLAARPHALFDLLNRECEPPNRFLPLDSISTLVTPMKYPTSGPHVETTTSMHRSLSSPVFGTSSQNFSEAADDSNATIIINGQSGKKAKKRKCFLANLKFPEAEPPAIRPRFQWYQGKGVVRVHLLIKNVLPCDMKIACTGRNLEFRCKADNCPYPPTRPEVPPRVLIEYHLPLRLQHRLHSEPEFVRFAPSRVEVHYRKVKPSVEWSGLWKSLQDDGKDAVELSDRKPANGIDDSSSDSCGPDDSDDDDEMSRPTKRFMNGDWLESPSTPSPAEFPALSDILGQTLQHMTAKRADVTESSVTVNNIAEWIPVPQEPYPGTSSPEHACVTPESVSQAMADPLTLPEGPNGTC